MANDGRRGLMDLLDNELGPAVLRVQRAFETMPQQMKEQRAWELMLSMFHGWIMTLNYLATVARDGHADLFPKLESLGVLLEANIRVLESEVAKAQGQNGARQ